MADNAGVTGIDPGSWQVTILPLPKRFSRGAALGFCGGHPVSRAENARAKSLGCWWPGGTPELLTFEGQQEVATGRASGDLIPGQWGKSTTGAMGAVVWRLHDGRPVGTDLHDRSYENTWATGAGSDAAIGAGSLPVKPGWRGTAASFCDITPKGFQSGGALGGTRGFQVGYVRVKDTTRNGSTADDNRAVLWQGAADRWIDLNALLPAKTYNASVAWAIEIRGDAVHVCGEARHYEVNNPGTPQESHVVPVAHPVLWTARLGGGEGRVGQGLSVGEGGTRG